MKLEQELNCEGYFGFGGGVAMTRGDRQEQELYCSAGCPLRDSCWDKHRARVRRLAPELVESFEDLVRECGDDGPEAVRRWAERNDGSLDPYSVVLTGNIEDGANVADDARPKDRGRFTLPWPLEKIE